MAKQPLNTLAPFQIVYNGSYIVIDENGIDANAVSTDVLKFSDGSVMTSAGAGLPAAIDSGTF